MTEPADGTWVLVVEDDDDLRMAIVDMLADFNVQAKAAEEGCDALLMLMEGARPGLILLDLHMPFMNGWEFRRCMQLDPAFAKIPIAIITGADVGRSVDSLQAVEILRKPLGLYAIGRLHDLILRNCMQRPPKPHALRHSVALGEATV